MHGLLTCASFERLTQTVTVNLVSQHQDADNWMDVWVGESGTNLYFAHKAGVMTTRFSANTSFSPNTWYHIAIERSIYAGGYAASFHQANERIGQINSEIDILECENASFGEKFYAGLDVGSWALGISSFITPFAYEGWLAAKGALGDALLGDLGSVGVPDEFMSPFATGQWRNWSDYEIAKWITKTNAINPTNSMTNCVNCAFALDQTLNSNLTVALDSLPKGQAQMIQEYSPYYGRTSLKAMWSDEIDSSVIIAQLNRSGNGARGIVSAFPAYGDGHVFNVINDAGSILVVDSQMNVVMPFESYIANNKLVELYFLLTTR